MMLGHVYDTGKIWTLWDFEHNRAIQCADVIFIDQGNAFTKDSGSNKNYFNIDESTSECEVLATSSRDPQNEHPSECGGGQAVSRHHINEGTSECGGPGVSRQDLNEDTSECGGPAIDRHQIRKELGRSDDTRSTVPSQGLSEVKNDGEKPRSA
jgi:hypothetical protein